MAMHKFLLPITKKAISVIPFLFSPLHVFAAQEADMTTETMVVSATSTSQSIQDAPANIAVVPRQTILERNATDVQDALHGIAGLQFTGVGMNRRAVSIHGMPTSHTLILIDGRRINNTDTIAHANFDLDAVPIDSVERIEVIKGPMSALYGSEALGGVINIITRQPDEHWHGNLNLQGGLTNSDSTTRNHKLGGHISGAIIPQTLYLTASADRHYRGNILAKENRRLSDIQGTHSDSSNLNLSWKMTAQQTLGIFYNESIEKLWRDTQSTGRQPVYYRANERIHRKGYGLSHEGHWNWGESTVNVYRNTLAHDVQYSNNVNVTSPHQHITDSIIDGRVSTRLLDRHLVTLGSEWRQEHCQNRLFSARSN